MPRWNGSTRMPRAGRRHAHQRQQGEQQHTTEDLQTEENRSDDPADRSSLRRTASLRISVASVDFSKVGSPHDEGGDTERGAHDQRENSEDENERTSIRLHGGFQNQSLG
jgi:hypothetical protein